MMSLLPIKTDEPSIVLDPSKMARSDLRQLYNVHTDGTRTAAARRGLWFAVIVYILFSICDFFLIADVAQLTSIARLLVGTASLFVLELAYRNKAGASVIEGLCALALVVGYLSWLVPALQTEAVATMRLYVIFGTIFMMGVNLFFILPFTISMFSSTAILVFMVFSTLLITPNDLNYLATFTLVYISCFIFTAYVNWKLNQERFHVFLNALEASYQHRQAEERGQALERLSNTDYLTGVDNRRAIDARLQECWDAWLSQDTSFAVILFDIDLFKRYNDCYGHQTGDECLITVARAVNTELRKHGVSFGRFGGEEFIAIAQVETKADALAIAEAIRRTVEDMQLPHEQRKDGISVVTVSVGIAMSRQSTHPSLNKIIQEADRALYAAKREGRNCVHFFDPRDPQSIDETETIAATLRGALQNNLANMVYQPIVNLSTGKIEAYEALMRMKMFDGTPISPSRFIPIAEDTGMILPLGLWAIRRACIDLLLSDRTPMVSVNISRVQLKSPSFARSVSDLLAETGIDGRRLALEITEGLDLDGQADALRCLRELSELGIRIWLDDFGTGFAGLSWLRMFPFDTVKIDKSFLHDASSASGRKMLSDIVDLVHHRGARILIEGVEDASQLELARELGAHQVQGYHTGRPTPADLAPVMSGVAPGVAKDATKPALRQIHPRQ